MLGLQQAKQFQSLLRKLDLSLFPIKLTVVA